MPDKPLQIASVAVVNSHGHVLVGRRNDSGKFTLPGGHMEEGETPAQGAARELKEEAGFDVHPDRLEPLGSDCITSEKGEQIEVHGFKVRNDAATTPAGDPDEECSGWFFVAPGPTGKLPAEVLSNLHAPRNTVLQRLGMQPVHDIEALERSEAVSKSIRPKLAQKIRSWASSANIARNRPEIHAEMMKPEHADDRRAMADGLAGDTKTRVIGGERHFLLHRGTHTHEAHQPGKWTGPAPYSETPTHVQYHNPTSFTADYGTAESEAEQRWWDHKAAGRPGRQVVHSMWVPESAISLSMDHASKLVGAGAKLPADIGFEEGQLGNVGEKEVFVAPGRYPKAKGGRLGKAQFGEHWHDAFHGWIEPSGKFHHMPEGVKTHGEHAKLLGHAHEEDAHRAGWAAVGHMRDNSATLPEEAKSDPSHPISKTLAGLVRGLPPSARGIHVLGTRSEGWPAWYVPRERAEKGIFSKPSVVAEFHGKSEGLAKEMWGHSDETKKMMGPFHGWINPYGGFHSMHANQTHQDGLANFLGELGMPNSVKTYGEMDAHTKAGWIGTAAAGLPSVVAHPDVIGDPSHPSTRKLALMVRRLPENITSIEVGQAAGADRPYDVPRRLAEKGIFKRPSATQEFRNRPEGLGKVVLWPRGEYGSPTVPEFTQDKVHGWISPEGHYHHMGPNEGHENFEHEGKTDRGLYDAGWLSLGHGGAHNVQGRERFLKDPDHPATRMARRLAGKYFGEKTLLAFPEMYGHGRPWDAGYMPTQEVNTRLWSKHGGTGQPAAAMFRSEGLGKIVLDRHYTGVDPARKPEGAHGWITPEGDYLPIPSDADHHRWIEFNEGQKADAAHKAGWLSVGHGGEGNVQGHSAFLFNPNHPATRTARRIAGKHFGEKTLLHPSDEYYSVLPNPSALSSKWVNTRLWSKHGRDTDVAESPQAMFRSEGELDKSARDWLAGTLAAASLLAPGQVHDAAPKSPQHVQAAPSAPLFGQHPMDKFLSAIRQLESSGGKKTSHKPQRHGLHAGTAAQGPFALMPVTVKDIAGKAKKYPEVAALAAKTPEEIQASLASDHGLALQAARALADHLHERTGGDPDRMAHAWRRGAYANPTPEQVAEDPYVQAFRGHLDKAELGKGSLQSRNRFSPGMIEPEDMVAMGDWQQKGGHPELRDTIMPMSGPARFRALHKLSAQAKTRLGQDGKREFLLHRGVDPDLEAPEVLDPKAGTVTHETVSSWTPHYEVAHQFARDYAHNAPKKEGKGYRPTVLSAWVHEDSVHNVPLQWGKLPTQEHFDRILGDNPDLEPESVPKPVGPNERRLRDEHEVLVAPHTSKVAHPAEVKRAAGYGKLEDLDQVVNERAKGGTHASPAVRMMQKPVRDRLRATLAARKPGLQKSSGLITFPHYGVKGQHYTVGYADPKRTGAAIRRITGSKTRMFDAYRGVVSGNMRADQRLPYAERKVVTGLAPSADLGTQRHEDQHTVFLQIGQEHGRHTRRAVARRLVESIPVHHRELFHKIADERTPSALPEQKDEEKICFLHSYLNSPSTRSHVHDVWESRGVPARQVDRMVKDVYRHMQRAGQQIVPVEALDRPVEKSEEGSVELHHYSDHPGLTSIDPAKHGTGVPGNESKRKGDPEWVDRSYHYLAGAKPEDSLAAKPHRYTSRVPAKGIYDIGTDPEGHTKDAKDKQGFPSINVVERRVRDAGHIGFKNSKTNPNVVALFHPVHPVRHEELHKSNYGPRGMGQYDPAANQKRKMGNVADTETGIQGIKVKTGANASGGQGKVRLERQWRAEQKRNKRQPVKVYTPEERVALQEQYRANPYKKRELDPRLGYKISHVEGGEDEFGDPTITVFAHDRHGDEVGSANFSHETARGGKKRLGASGVFVEADHRRKGIATAMYQHAEKVTGKKIIPDADQSDYGRALWAQPKRKFGEPKVDTGFDKAEGHGLPRKFSILTHENPAYRVRGMKGKAKFEAALAGHKYERIAGKYAGKKENSYLVHDADPAEMERIGRAAGQESVLHSEGGKHRLVYTNGPNAGRHHAGEGVTVHPKEPGDNYSTRNGKHFTLGLDFSKLHEPSKKAEKQGHHLVPIQEGRRGKRIGIEERIRRLNYHLANMYDAGQVRDLSPAEHTQLHRPFKKRDLDPKEGITITHHGWPVKAQHADNFYTEVQAHKDGEKIGGAVVFHTPESMTVRDVRVDARYRRRGVASAMYQHAEKTTGRKLSPDDPDYQSREGKAFWAQPKRKFGKPFKKRDLDPKEGIKITHGPDPMGAAFGRDDYIRVEAKRKGKVVGHVQFHAPREDDTLLNPLHVEVDSEHRRKGIASAMYRHAERVTSRTVLPAAYQTPLGQKLWAQPKRKFGKAELRKEMFHGYSDMFPFHGWISPKGEFHPLDPGDTHYGTHLKDIGFAPGDHRAPYEGEWISVGHGGEPVMAGREDVLTNPNHPATRRLTQMVRALPERHQVVHVGFEPGGGMDHHVPRHIAERGNFRKPSEVQMFRSEPMVKELRYKPESERAHLRPFHGWISPDGEFNQMSDDEVHHKVGASRHGGGMDLYEKGWISTGHAGSFLACGHARFLHDPNHPATKKLAQMVRGVSAGVDKIPINAYGLPGMSGAYDSPRHLAEAGNFRKPSPVQMFRSEGWATRPEPVLGRSRALPALAQMLSDAGLKFDPHASQLDQAFPGAGSDRLFEAARFLSNAPARDPEKEAKAMGSDDPTAAALAAYGLEDTKEMRRALYAVAELEDSSLDKSEKSDGMKFAPRTARGEDMALAANRALEAGKARTLENPGKFTSEALVLEDPETQGRRVLAKPEPKRAPMPQGVEPGMSCSDREEAFSVLAGVLGLGSFVPKACSALDGEGNPWALIEMLPPEFRSLQRWRQASPGAEKAIFDKHLRDGSLHMWAVLDWVAGSCDRHGGNVLADSDGNVSLIDNGSSMADELFNPSGDHATFIPYYLRYCGAKRTAQPEDTLSKMPLPPPGVSDAVGGWVLGIDPAAVMAAVAPACGMGIARAVLGRLVALQAAVSKSAEPACAVVNALWAGTGRKN